MKTWRGSRTHLVLKFEVKADDIIFDVDVADLALLDDATADLDVTRVELVNAVLEFDGKVNLEVVLDVDKDTL